MNFNSGGRPLYTRSLLDSANPVTVGRVFHFIKNAEYLFSNINFYNKGIKN